MGKTGESIYFRHRPVAGSHDCRLSAIRSFVGSARSSHIRSGTARTKAKKSSRSMSAIAGPEKGEYSRIPEPVTTSAVMTPTMKAARTRLRSISNLSKMAIGIAASTAPVTFSSPNQVYTPHLCEAHMPIHQDGSNANGIRSIDIDDRK